MPYGGGDMRKVLPFLVVGFLIVAALIGSLIYTSDTAIYECSGVMTKDSDKSPITLFAQITQYRWWAFWNPLDGLLRLEIQSAHIPTVLDDPLAVRWLKTGPNSLVPARSSPDSDLAHGHRLMRERTFSVSDVLSLI